MRSCASDSSMELPIEGHAPQEVFHALMRV